MRGARAYGRVLRERWAWVLAGLGVGLVVASVLIMTLPSRYASEASVLVGVDSAPGNVTAAYDGELLAQQKVQVYVPLLSGPQFAGLVSEELARQGVPDQPAAVQQALGATSVGESPVIRLTATGASASQAQDRAAAAATAASTLVSALEAPEPGAPTPVFARVAAQASVPGPPSPSPALLLTVGLLLGLAGGVVAALARDAHDDSIRAAPEAQRAAGAPVLGVLDEDRAHPRHPLVLHQGARSRRADQIRIVRTALALRHEAEQSEVILVSRALAREGKTSFACDLAISAAQGGRRVLLLGTDLHRPRLGDFLGIEEAVGLSTVLSGRVGHPNVIQRWGRDLLDVLPAGRVPEQPLDLIGSPAMSDLLAIVRREYDLVVMDAPPVLAVPDASVLARVADGVVLVVARGLSREEDVAEAATRLRTSGTLLGLVVNRVRSSRAPYVSDAASEEFVAAPTGAGRELDAATVAVPLKALRYRVAQGPDMRPPAGTEASDEETVVDGAGDEVEHESTSSEPQTERSG